MSKKDANGVRSTFKSFIEKIKMERLIKQCYRNVEVDPTLIHFIWNELDTIQYQIIQGDCEYNAKITPKMEYALVIADILHGFNFLDIGYDSELFTYQAFSKVVTSFHEVTTTPLWRFGTFQSDTICNVINKLQGKLKDATYMVRH